MVWAELWGLRFSLCFFVVHPSGSETGCFLDFFFCRQSKRTPALAIGPAEVCFWWPDLHRKAMRWLEIGASTSGKGIFVTDPKRKGAGRILTTGRGLGGGGGRVMGTEDTEGTAARAGHAAGSPSAAVLATGLRAVVPRRAGVNKRVPSFSLRYAPGLPS